MATYHAGDEQKYQTASYHILLWPVLSFLEGITESLTKVVAQSVQFLPDNTAGDTVVEKGKVIEEGEFELREVA